jgi:hypothetical protein
VPARFNLKANAAIVAYMYSTLTAITPERITTQHAASGQKLLEGIKMLLLTGLPATAPDTGFKTAGGGRGLRGLSSEAGAELVALEWSPASHTVRADFRPPPHWGINE